MARVKGTTDRQIDFLNAFRQNPAGPPADQWPSPYILRRWLRSAVFRHALDALQKALRVQTDFLVASAAAGAARNLDGSDADPDRTRRVASLLHMAHLRDRFRVNAPDPAPDEAAKDDFWERHQAHCEKCRNIGSDITEDRLDEFAWRRHYQPPLERLPDFPDPTPQDTFYYNLLHDPRALLWYLKLYQDKTHDDRFASILHNCQGLIPNEQEPQKLPQFASVRTPK